jgi:hypothetical protein
MAKADGTKDKRRACLPVDMTLPLAARKEHKAGAVFHQTEIAATTHAS